MAMMRKDSEGLRRIDGEGVYLRAPELRDYHDWAELREASRAYLAPWEPTWASDELSRGSFKYKLRRYVEDARDDRAYALFVFRDEDDELLGGVTLSNIRRGVAQMASLGYWAGERHAGKGYTTAAVRAVVMYAFDDLDLHRVEAACQPNNFASRRVLEKAGFTHEGVARAYLKINGDWRDHLLFGITNNAG
ncbi:MAG: GNAT family N-acetyltransferase [Hyphomonadaceae bacterium]|nr:GNAT family N-acetyltransferase [Hyphomonadaceae bacterium]MBX3511634.1 GNAT family N-acetyltransferase [Hyphomonadaceae bacterium]